MTNQLLLAQVLAEGFNGDYLWHWTHDQEIGKALVAACATVIAALIAITGVVLTVRKTTQQIELSKQGTPPELTRYKTWVEVSEKYKELREFEKANSFKDPENEYQEIRASRKVALERAVWERKVISECSNIQAQKLVMELPESKIYEINNPDINRGIELSADSYIKPKASGIMWLIYLIVFSLLPILMVVTSGSLTENRWVVVIFSIIIFVPSFPMFRHVAPNQYNGIFEANYFLRKKRADIFREMRKLEDEDNSFDIFCKVDQGLEEWCRREGLRYASVFNTWADYVHCPWVGKVWYKKIWHKFWCYFCPGHYVRRSLKGKTEVLWGSYKDDKLNGDLKKKLGHEDTQAPNSDTPEESQPTPPQG